MNDGPLISVTGGLSRPSIFSIKKGKSPSNERRKAGVFLNQNKTKSFRIQLFIFNNLKSNFWPILYQKNVFSHMLPVGLKA